MVGKNREERKVMVASGLGSPYSLGEDDIHLMPIQIQGRAGANPKPGHFTGYVDMDTGMLRVDHTGETEFWLRVDLSALLDIINKKN